MDVSTESLVIRRARVGGEVVDCRVAEGVVTHLAQDLPTRPGEAAVDAAGGAVLPGLHDHHVHALAAAAAACSLDLEGGALPPAGTPSEGHGWVRVVGLGDDDATVEHLDGVWPDRPVRVQHRSGALWILNGAAIELLGDVLEPDERRTGRVWRGDARLTRAMMRLDPRDVSEGLRAWGAELADWGVTGFSDATPGLSADSLQLIRARVPQDVVSLGTEDDGLPVKIVAPDHEHDVWDGLLGAVRSARALDRPVAVHAVSATALAVVLAVLDEVGVVDGDRIEHAAECDDATADRLAELGLTVVTQPTIAARRAQTLGAEYSPDDRRWWWRVRGLRDRGVRVALSSDAPYGDVDPWATVRIAAGGLPGAGTSWWDDQTIPARMALESFLTSPRDPAGAPRTVRVGARADLCVLDAPLEDVLDRVVAGDRGSPVTLTLIGGRIVSRRPGCTDVRA